MARRLLALCAAVAMVVAVNACSHDDGNDSASPTATSTEMDPTAGEGTTDDESAEHGSNGDTGDDDTTGDGSSTDDTAEEADPVDDGPCPVETELAIRNSDGIDGTLDPVTVFADVILDATADLVVATYQVDEDPQFGISAPVGVPEVPDGGIIFQLSLFAGVGQDLATGVYVDDDETEPRITFISLYSGAQRILPLGDHTLTLTEYSEDRLCGEITAATDPDEMQSFPVVEGRFVAERV